MSTTDDPAITGSRARGENATFWSFATLGTHGIDLALWLVDDDVVEVALVREPASGAE